MGTPANTILASIGSVASAAFDKAKDVAGDAGGFVNETKARLSGRKIAIHLGHSSDHEVTPFATFAEAQEFSQSYDLNATTIEVDPDDFQRV